MPTTLLSVIDECLSEAELDRKYVATVAAVTNVLPDNSSHESKEDVFAD